MIAFDIQELVGLFETIEKNDEKIADKKSQEKMIKADSNEKITEFGKEKELKPTYIRQAYKHWKSVKENDDEDSDDLYTIMALIDGLVEQENEEAKQKAIATENKRKAEKFNL